MPKMSHVILVRSRPTSQPGLKILKIRRSRGVSAIKRIASYNLNVYIRHTYVNSADHSSNTSFHMDHTSFHITHNHLKTTLFHARNHRLFSLATDRPRYSDVSDSDPRNTTHQDAKLRQIITD